MSQPSKLRKACDGALNAIRDAEGFELRVYPCPAGFPTVGWGHRVLSADDLQFGDPITLETAETMLQQDVGAATRSATRWYAERLAVMNAPRIAVLIEMAFALGAAGLYAFEKMAAAIKIKDWPAAGAEIKDSLWWRKDGAKWPGVKTRILRLERQMASGQWQ